MKVPDQSGQLSLRITFAICWARVVLAQQSANVQSPEIGADRRVTFRLNAPKAQEVTLTGEFLKSGLPLVKGANGVWTVTAGPIEPEIYHYNFTVDGVRIIDPANPNLKTGSTASTLASVLEVRGDALSFYDGQNVPHGEIRTHWYHSKLLGSLRRLTVYTPPRYDRELQTRYPVVYLFHGANADETAWYRLGRVNFILDNLLASGKIKPFIVVMPFGYGVAPGGPQAENTAKFGKDLVEDVIPYIEGNYLITGAIAQGTLSLRSASLLSLFPDAARRCGLHGPGARRGAGGGVARDLRATRIPSVAIEGLLGSFTLSAQLAPRASRLRSRPDDQGQLGEAFQRAIRHDATLVGARFFGAQRRACATWGRQRIHQRAGRTSRL